LKKTESIKIALPKGRLLAETAARLEKAGWGLDGYDASARLYRIKSKTYPQLSAKMFHERDIPVQVAIGNYDLGICGSDWLEELMVKYPSSALMKVGSLGYARSALYVAVSAAGGVPGAGVVSRKAGVVRIASEYPNLAESFAVKLRLRRFSVFPLWGAAEVYPPESADLALIPGGLDGGLLDYDLVPVSQVIGFGACLIANRDSWQAKDMGEIVASIGDNQAVGPKRPSPSVAKMPGAGGQYPSPEEAEEAVRLALPDGHQQMPTVDMLNKAGIEVDDYPSPAGNRRPTTNLAGVVIKVVRPQDMPLQVANGNFDLAVTGQDWLLEHIYRFPSSPVTRLLDLKLGKVKIVAVVSKELPASDVYSLRQLNAERLVPFRVASEYINIADKYARDNHLGMYRIIPTWGASEAFLPEDADLLIENTQTGRTIARHNLRIIDTLFESTACLIGHRDGLSGSVKSERIKSIAQALQAAVEDTG
jgi:ATP phosphoribosyltransferase